MYSLIILNWKRPNNTIRIINNMKKFKFINEIIISNGNLEYSIYIKDKKIKIYNDYENINSIYSLDQRFICGLRARNKDIIIIDDDLYIEENELTKILIEYNKNKNRIVGCFGRNLNNGLYKFQNIFGDVDIILTRLLVCQKKLCSLFFICKPLIENIYKEGIPYGNGEDIFFSFISTIYLKNKNYSLKNIKTIELPDENVAISKNMNHLNYRIKLCTYLYNNYNIFKNFIEKLKI
jgi:hypothetical protein